jgi:hypothetical protein
MSVSTPWYKRFRHRPGRYHGRRHFNCRQRANSTISSYFRRILRAGRCLGSCQTIWKPFAEQVSHQNVSQTREPHRSNTVQNVRSALRSLLWLRASDMLDSKFRRPMGSRLTAEVKGEVDFECRLFLKHPSGSPTEGLDTGV